MRFDHCCRQRGITLPRRNCTIEYHSDIPFGVGLGGSSAIITAVFKALMQFYELTEANIPRAEQPNVILEAETVELGISAGPQDRVVAVYGGVVAMDFSPSAYARNGGRHGDYRQLAPDLLPPLFVAYHEGLSRSSGSIHNVMRYRAEVEHDRAITEAMAAKAALVDEALKVLSEGKLRPARAYHGSRLRPATGSVRPAPGTGPHDQYSPRAGGARQVHRIGWRRHRHL